MVLFDGCTSDDRHITFVGQSVSLSNTFWQSNFLFLSGLLFMLKKFSNAQEITEEVFLICAILTVINSAPSSHRWPEFRSCSWLDGIDVDRDRRLKGKAATLMSDIAMVGAQQRVFKIQRHAPHYLHFREIRPAAAAELEKSRQWPMLMYTQSSSGNFHQACSCTW